MVKTKFNQFEIELTSIKLNRDTLTKLFWIGVRFLFLDSLCVEFLCALRVLSVATLLGSCIQFLPSTKMHIVVDGSQHNTHDEVRIPKKHKVKRRALSAMITN